LHIGFPLVWRHACDSLEYTEECRFVGKDTNKRVENQIIFEFFQARVSSTKSNLNKNPETTKSFRDF